MLRSVCHRRAQLNEHPIRATHVRNGLAPGLDLRLGQLDGAGLNGLVVRRANIAGHEGDLEAQTAALGVQQIQHRHRRHHEKRPAQDGLQREIGGVPPHRREDVLDVDHADEVAVDVQEAQVIQLLQHEVFVESMGGEVLDVEVSAKNKLNLDKLLEAVLLQAEILDLKANPDKNAIGTVIESSLDKGRGYVTTMLVQAGTLHVGDTVLAGKQAGKVKALFNERGGKLQQVGPSQPVIMLGMPGPVQAGDQFHVMDDEREARDIANKRQQLQREQGIRTHKHITLDEIGRRLAIGNFKELNVIVKGDVDGSVEALADSLLKLSTAEIQVNVIHKSVGAITETDVNLAAASNAIVIGFQVRPSINARKLAEQEEIDIRLYSIIYDAINELKSAMEGMLAPEFEEKIICNIEVRETFKVPKAGTVAGCMVLDGKINRNTKVRVIRDGIVAHSGELSSLRRFKDDVKEVASGYECGLSINNFNDIQIGDIIEGYEQVAVKRTLA